MPAYQHDRYSGQMNPLPVTETYISQTAAAAKFLRQGISFCLCRFPEKENVELYHRVEVQSDADFIVRSWSGEVNMHFKQTEAGVKIGDSGNARSFEEDVSLPEETTFAAYKRGFEAAMDAFKNGQFQKLVLSRVKLIAKPLDFDLLDFFATLESAYPCAFVYLLASQECGIWLGATPEVLLEGSQGNWHTHSLAGTRVAAGAEEPWGEKELQEQELVSAHIRAALGQAGVKNWDEQGPQTVQAGSVAHLRTLFNFQMHSGQDDLLKSLHPTPAIAGLPADAAKDWIARHEAHDRSLYTGYLGSVDFPERAALHINLRCMQVSKNHLALYLGGGLTAQSKLYEEWNETEHKALTLEKLLNGSN